ncbi:hypothetical protein [Ammoniphilus sp. 3BR4]|uniref:hypothetical protein n=1 Tax=Ammoniphilus sp. 3BR4 TaxID=3158265 RepID=UPI003466EF0B
MIRIDFCITRSIRETYKWLLVPSQEATPNKGVTEKEWEAIQIQSNAKDTVEEIIYKLKEHELLIPTWSPVHLKSMLQTWFWKEDLTESFAMEVWKKMCHYLYLPRLVNQEVYRQAIEVGVCSNDFFGVAYGKVNGDYQGFIVNQKYQCNP